MPHKLTAMLYFLPVLLLFSCINHINEDIDDKELAATNFNFSIRYDIGSMDAKSRLGNASNLKEYAKTLLFYDYVNGEKVNELSFASNDSDFGNLHVNLSEGTHQLVFVAHNSDQIDFKYPNLSSDKIKDTFTQSINLTIDSDSDKDHNINLSRSVGKLFIVANDPIPADAASFRVTLADCYHTYDVTTNNVSGDLKPETRTFQYTDKHIGQKGSTYSIYFFIGSSDYKMAVLMELLNRDGEVIFTNKLTNVPIKRNTQTKIIGNVFSFDVHETLAVQTKWDDEIIYSLK